MSRKNYLLKKNGIGLIISLVIIILICSFALSVNFNGKNSSSFRKDTQNLGFAIPLNMESLPQVTGLTITVIPTGNTLNLSWNALNGTIPDFLYYRIYRSVNAGFTPNASTYLINTTNNQYSDRELTDGVTYYYSVSALNTSLIEGPPSDEKYGIPMDTTPPPKITGVEVTVVPLGNTLNITWTASTTPDIAGYRVYQSTTPGFTPSPTNNMANRTVAYYLDTGLPDGVTRYYRIRAYDEVPNIGSASWEASGTPQDTTAPPQVTGLTVTVVPTGNTLQLSWTASSASDLWAYRIYRSTISGFTPSPANRIANTSLTTYTNSGLTDGIAYYYRVTALDEVPNEGVASDEKVGIPQDTTPPAQVTGLTVKVVAPGNALNLQWTSLSGSTPDLQGYRIHRSMTSGFTPGPANLIATTPNNYYNNTGLTDGMTYYYRIMAYDEIPNTGTPSAQASGTPRDTVAPSQVSGLQVFVFPSGNQLIVQWSTTGGDTAGYRVWRNITATIYTLITARTVNYYNDTGLMDGTCYFYKISAYDEVPNYGVNSTPVSGIPRDTTPPPQVSGLQVFVVPSGNQLIVQWSTIGGDTAGYRVWRNITATIYALVMFRTVNYYNDTGLINGKIYWYKISAVDEVPNQGGNSTAVSSIPKDTVAPPAVTGLHVTGIPNGINLTWDPSSAPDIDHYNVYMSTSPGFTPEPPNNIYNATHPITYYLNDTLTDGVTYYFKIRAVDDDKNLGPTGIPVSGPPPDPGPPSQVIGIFVNVVATGNALNLQWNDLKLSVPDVAGYRIYRHTVSGFPSEPQYLRGSTSNLYYNDTGLTDNVTYYYLITAYDEVPNEGPDSVQVSGTPKDTVAPQQVVNLNVVSTGVGNTLQLTWTASTATDFSQYLVYRNTTTLPWTLIATPGINSYTDTGLTDNIRYFYKVAAKDEGGPIPNIGLNSTIKSAIPTDTIPPPQVLTFTAIAGTDGSITLTWTAITPPDFQSYNLYRWQGYNLAFPTNPSTQIVKIRINKTLFYVDNQSNLIDGQLYTYKIAVADEVGDSRTKYATGFTSGDNDPPTAPTGLIVRNEGTGDILNLTWYKKPELDVHHYRVYRNSTTQSWTLIATCTSNYYPDRGLIEYQRYFYFITAIDEAKNEGPPSTIKSGIPIDIKPPGPPTIREPVSRTGRTVILAIKSPSDLDVLCYNIYRSNVSGFIPNGTYSILIAQYWPKSGEFTICLDVNLANGTYYYKVVALDEKYQASLSSNEARIIITLYAPVWVTITDNKNGDLTLKWQDNSTNTPYSIIGWYRIYRMNTSNPILIYIGNVSSLSVYPVTYQYIDYGLPNGNWTYYITTVDKFFGESAFSKAYSIFINDIVKPGAPTGLNHVTPNGLPIVTISWTRPANTYNGSDVFRYEIYISRTPISNLTGLLPNATIYGFGWHPNKTIRDLNYPLTSFTFYNLSDDTYYLVVIAYDENNFSSPISNMLTYIVDTTEPTIYADTIQYPRQLLVGKEARINVTLYDRYGISSVYIRYTTDGINYFTAYISSVTSFPNGTRIYSGIIAGQEAVRTINFTITVIDSCGNSRTSSTFSYQVISQEPSPTLLILLFIGAIGGICITYLVKYYRKEHTIGSILERVVKEPSTPALSNTEAQTTENVIPDQNQTEELFQDTVEPASTMFETPYQMYAGQFEGFTLILLYRIFNTILKLSPSLELMFPREERLNYVIKIKALSPQNQYSIFKAMIGRNSEKEIRMQLYNLINEFKYMKLDGQWKLTLPGLENLVDLTQALDDHEFLTDIYLLMVLIRSSNG